MMAVDNVCSERSRLLLHLSSYPRKQIFLSFNLLTHSIVWETKSNFNKISEDLRNKEHCINMPIFTFLLKEAF